MDKIKFIIVSLVILVLGFYMIDVVRFPECYLSVDRYHLENAVNLGDEEAIEYYNRVYVANGRTLFDD